MAINMDKFTITSFDQFTGYDRVTGNLEMILDELSDASISHEQESTDITGKGGRRISTLKKNKSVTVSGTNGLLSGGALAAMLGDDIDTEAGDENVRYTLSGPDFKIDPDTHTITVKMGYEVDAQGNRKGYYPIPWTMDAGSQILKIYVRDEKSKAFISGGNALVQDASATSATAFTCTITPDSSVSTLYEAVFTFDEAYDDREVVIIYQARVQGYKISNNADNYSKVLSGFLDVTCQDACDNEFHGQFIFPRADFSGAFELTGGSDPSTQSFEFSSLPDLCNNNKDLYDFIIFEE